MTAVLVDACLGVGANLGDRSAAIAAAVDALTSHAGVQSLRLSRIYETEPVGPAGQGRYLNAAIRLQTTLSARELLVLCLALERDAGRDRAGEVRWGPRQLDLDLLLYGDAIIDEPGLTVPHPHLAERTFVLDPLADVADEVIHPVLNLTISTLRQRLRAASAT